MLEELQALDPAKKKQVLIISTIIIMIIVVGVWAVYFNSIVASSVQQDAPAQTTSTDTTVTAPVPIAIAPAPATSTTVQASGPGLWQNIENGFVWIGNIFRRPSEYTIQPKGK